VEGAESQDSRVDAAVALGSIAFGVGFVTLGLLPTLLAPGLVALKWRRQGCDAVRRADVARLLRRVAW